MAITPSEIRVEGMTVSWQESGGSELDLGATEGGSTVNFEYEATDITADQTGGVILDSVSTMVGATAELTLKEVSTANLKALLGDSIGSSLTPSGGSLVQGIGSGNVFRSMSGQAGKLRLVPVGGSSSARSVMLHKAYPILSSISYSPSDPSTISVTFKCMRDSTVNSAVDLLVIGDITQDFS